MAPATATASLDPRPAKQPKPLPAPNSDFYEVYETLNAEELAIGEAGARFHGDQGRAGHHQILGGRRLSLRAAAGGEGAGHRRARNEGLRLRRRKRGAAGFRPNGDCPHRPVVLDVHGRARRPGDGLHLHRRIRRAEAEVAAADGALRKDRVFRPHRAAGWFRRLRRPADHGEARGRHLDPQWRETVDRQRAMVRRFHHLGARRRR